MAKFTVTYRMTCSGSIVIEAKDEECLAEALARASADIIPTPRAACYDAVEVEITSTTEHPE